MRALGGLVVEDGRRTLGRLPAVDEERSDGVGRRACSAADYDVYPAGLP